MIMLKVGQSQLRIGWKLHLGLWSFVTHMGSIFLIQMNPTYFVRLADTLCSDFSLSTVSSLSSSRDMV